MDFRSLLARPFLYRLFADLVGATRSRSTFVCDYARPRPGERVLDIGCGPGDILEFFPPVEYIGLDISASYIEAARRRFSGRARFLCHDISRPAPEPLSGFDLALATGVIHHLPDADVLRLLETARNALRPGGRFLSLDGCYLDGQSSAARFLLSRDRGKHVRTPEGYRMLASRVFRAVRDSIRHDLLRIPYTLIILECTA